MSDKKIDGKGLALSLRAQMAEEVSALTPKLGRPPGLGVLLVGEDAASQVYVRNKELAATKAGMHSSIRRLPATATQEEVLEAVGALNSDETIDGFLVQLPLPKGLDEHAVTAAIAPAKDADGLHVLNLGALTAGTPAPRPCTPFGCIQLLKHAGVEMSGKHAVVIGRSTIVGKPMALLLLAENATVTVCHSRTKNLEEEVRRADIVVAAVGRPEMVKGSWLKPGAAVIDVGINRGENGLVGDVDYEDALTVASKVTPVPGGVGPMTIAMLLKNTLELAKSKVD